LFSLSVPTSSADEDSCVVMEVQSIANDDAASLAQRLSAKFSASTWAKELALLRVFKTATVRVIITRHSSLAWWCNR